MSATEVLTPLVLFASIGGFIAMVYCYRRFSFRRFVHSRASNTNENNIFPSEQIVLPGFVVSSSSAAPSGQLSTETSGAFTTSSSGATFNPDGITITVPDESGSPVTGLNISLGRGSLGYANPYGDAGSAFGGQANYLGERSRSRSSVMLDSTGGDPNVIITPRGSNKSQTWIEID